MPTLTGNDIIKQIIMDVPGADVPDLLYRINSQLERVASKRRWRFYQTTYQFDLTAAYSTGTVEVTNGSTTVTGTDTVWTSAMEGRIFSVNGLPGTYIISTVNSNTELVLDRAWARDSDSALNYLIYVDKYDLPTNCRSIISVYNLKTGAPMRPVTKSYRQYTWKPYGDSGYYMPDEYCVWGRNATTGAMQIEVNGAPSTADPIEVTYFRLPTSMTNIYSTVDAPSWLCDVLLKGLIVLFKSRQVPVDPNAVALAQMEYNMALDDAHRFDSELAHADMRNERGGAFAL